MILGFTLGFAILFMILGFICVATDSEGVGYTSILCGIMAVIFFVVGCFNGFVDYPPTEGTHQGVITAVDLEGVYFRRYEIYLKSSGYTDQSDETAYLIYENEKELAEQLKEAIGKEVKLTYGHDGGYIPWDSCGTYHIKSFEIVEKGE